MRLALGNGGHEAPGNAGQVGAALGAVLVHAANKIVLLIGHDPRALAGTAEPRGGVPEVEGLHGAVVIIAAVDLSVAVVETATGVVMFAAHHPILPFCLVV